MPSLTLRYAPIATRVRACRHHVRTCRRRRRTRTFTHRHLSTRCSSAAYVQGDHRFSASAIFSFTARMNHSCRPCAFVDPLKADHAPGRLEAADGVIRVKALRQILPGEALRELVVEARVTGAVLLTRDGVRVVQATASRSITGPQSL